MTHWQRWSIGAACLLMTACGNSSGPQGTPRTPTAIAPMVAQRVVVLGDQVQMRDARNGHLLWQHPYTALFTPRLVVTPTVSYLATDHLYALRNQDGAVLWTSAESSTGATLLLADAQRVYVLVDQQLRAYRVSDGQHLWSQPVDDHVAPVLAPDDQTVYVTTTNAIAALDLATGTPRWTTPAATQGTIDPPVAVGDRVLVVTNDVLATHSQISAYQEKDGQAAWTTSAAIGPILAADAQRVYAIALNLQTQTNQVIALTVATGHQAWSYPYPLALNTQIQPAAGSIIVTEGSGPVDGLDAATGQRRWQTMQDATQQALFSADRGYVLSTSGYVTAFSLRTGTFAWIAPHAGSLITASDTALYVRDGTTLTDLAATTGAVQWQATIANTVLGTLRVVLVPEKGA